MTAPALTLALGIWRAVLFTPGGELPFNFEVTQTRDAYALTLMNGEERIRLDEVMLVGDSLIAQFPVYESELRLHINGDTLTGVFINRTRQTNGTIPMRAVAHDNRRFISHAPPTVDCNGKFAVTFSPMQPGSSDAVGVFKTSAKDKSKVTGTFLTNSGDYRYLDGTVSGDSLMLSTFNGVFVYLFKAKISEYAMRGTFWSGTHHNEPWNAVRDSMAALPDPNSLTTYTGDFQFEFPDVDSVMLALSDDRFKGKAVVVQFMGSWCPNCLDESVYLVSYYNKHRKAEVEFVGLSFEKTDDFRHAAANVARFVKRLEIPYPVLIAGNRTRRQDIYPALQNFQGYPTTVFLDKQHRVRRIHAGFNGPATGAEYEVFKDEFERFVEQLSNEKL